VKKRKIKIVHIVEGFVGGMSTYLCNVLPKLADSSFDVTLICSLGRCCADADEKIDHLRRKGVKVYTVPMQRAINPVIDLYILLVITKFLFRGKFAIVHTHCSKGGALGRLAAIFAGVKIRFHSSHCFAFLRCGSTVTKKISLSVERFLGKFTTKFIAVSVADAESAETYRIFPTNKCFVVNNGLSLNGELCRYDTETLSEIKASFDLPSDSFIVATSCRIVEYKGVFTFIDAAGLSKSKSVFVIAGDGELKTKVERYILVNQLSEKVKLLGYVSNMDRLYRICDIVVLCSTLEAQSYLLLEAMRAKCAIVASNVPGNRELLKDQRGLLVEPESGEIAEAIDCLLSNSEKRKLFTQNSYDYLCKEHKLEVQVQKLTDIYFATLRHKEREHNIASCARS
jgi:glycosyltransferase involved in cell wall biosynthesis